MRSPATRCRHAWPRGEHAGFRSRPRRAVAAGLAAERLRPGAEPRAHDQGLLTTDAPVGAHRSRRRRRPGRARSPRSRPGCPCRDSRGGSALAQALRRPGRRPRRRPALARHAAPPPGRRAGPAATGATPVQRGRHRLAQAAAAASASAKSQRNAVLRALALFHATDFDDNALQRLSDLPAGAADRRHARVARARGARPQNWKAVLAAIDALPAEQQARRRMALLPRPRAGRTGRAGASAQRSFNALAEEADLLRLPRRRPARPAVRDLPAAAAADDPQRWRSRCWPARACSGRSNCLRWTCRARRGANGTGRSTAPTPGQPPRSRRCWPTSAAGTTAPCSPSAAATRCASTPCAFRWPARTAWCRRPSRPASIRPGPTPSPRAESAWMSDAHSGADARGLMQLLPATAAQVARRYGLPWSGGDSLYDPAVNVALGTRYLAQMAERFNGAPWLASAAYNAGPIKVDQWLAARGTCPGPVHRHHPVQGDPRIRGPGDGLQRDLRLAPDRQRRAAGHAHARHRPDIRAARRRGRAQAGQLSGRRSPRALRPRPRRSSTLTPLIPGSASPWPHSASSSSAAPALSAATSCQPAGRATATAHAAQPQPRKAPRARRASPACACAPPTCTIRHHCAQSSRAPTRPST